MKLARGFSNADHYHVLGATISITASSETTDGKYLVLDMLVPPMFTDGLHTHPQSELVHVVDGEIRLHVDGEDEILGPGTSGHVSGSEPHGVANTGDSTARVVATMTPADAEAFFHEVGQPTKGRSLPEPVEPTEPLLQALFAGGEEHGFQLLSPLPEPLEQ